MIKPLSSFTIEPRLPESIQQLHALSRNLYWVWDGDAIDLFRRLDPTLWETVYHNAVAFLGAVAQEKLEEAAENEAFLAHLKRVWTNFQRYMNEPRWYQQHYGQNEELQVAYFSFEFGLTECLQSYSGGLGILAGDHLKTASDMGIPLCAVGVLYHLGYFHQVLTRDGWQQERYDEIDFYNQPMTRMTTENGEPLKIEVPHLNARCVAEIWRIDVGRVPLYALNTNLPENGPDERALTSRLYGGDQDMRIRQEILLGVGGMAALGALGIQPDVCHMNEGHSAFLSLERIRRLMHDKGLDFSVAREATSAGNVFTTHTPVPAGNDIFGGDLVGTYMKPMADALGVPWNDFLAQGRQKPEDENEAYCMTVLALRNSRASNGVSKLHGEVSRDMWKEMWPSTPNQEVPISHITNGVHIFSWLSPELASLFDLYIGPDWRSEPQNPEIWERVHAIPDEEIWRIHGRRRENLVAFCRRHVQHFHRQRGVTTAEMQHAMELLDPEALTIGFARRFATYKRATLLFRDMDRLRRIIDEGPCKVQFLFSGKAHPKDNAGKEFIREIIRNTRQEPFSSRFVFLEDYDINVARYMYTGCDVWLNNPRRPMEASGTSGMKAAANGALNLSILDGWWDEGYNTHNGWAIGYGEHMGDSAQQDAADANALYDTLENEVVPEFTDRGKSSIPRGWVRRMKNAIATVIPQFCSHRMVQDYLEKMYVPSNSRWRRMQQDDFERAKQLAGWKSGLSQQWEKLSIANVDVAFGENENGAKPKVGDEITVTATLDLQGLQPRDVLVECYHGYVDAEDSIVNGTATRMTLRAFNEPNEGIFRVSFPCQRSGRYGATVRVFPYHADLNHKFETHLVTWAQG